MLKDEKYELSDIADKDNRSAIEFEKLRFEHAWRYFDVYGRQRLQMFNFFLISAAFFSAFLQT